jgi:hypothetical protein
MSTKRESARDVGATVGIAIITVNNADVGVLEMRRQPRSVREHLWSSIALVCHDTISFSVLLP